MHDRRQSAATNRLVTVPHLVVEKRTNSSSCRQRDGCGRVGSKYPYMYCSFTNYEAVVVAVVVAVALVVVALAVVPVLVIVVVVLVIAHI